MNKPVYLGISILALSKILIFEFWYDYVNPKYTEKLKLCYMGTDSFIVYIKIDDIYKNIAEDIETRFDTSNYELDRPLLKGKIKKVIELMKEELGGKIMTIFVRLIVKAYSYLIDNSSEDKKAKCTKKCVIKRKPKFQDYKNCLEAAQIENKINHLEKNKNDVDNIQEDKKESIKNSKLILKARQKFISESHNAFTKEINKIALSSIDDK